LAQFVSSQ